MFNRINACENIPTNFSQRMFSKTVYLISRDFFFKPSIAISYPYQTTCRLELTSVCVYGNETTPSSDDKKTYAHEHQ